MQANVGRRTQADGKVKLETQTEIMAAAYGRSLGLDAVAAARSPIRSTPGRILLAAAT